MAEPTALRLGENDKAGITEAERLVKEAEFGARDLSGWSFWLAGAVALLMTAFQVWTAGTGTLPGVLQRSVHLSFAMVLVFFFYPAGKSRRQRRLPWYDLVLAAVGAYTALYVTIYHTELIARVGAPATVDLVVGDDARRARPRGHAAGGRALAPRHHRGLPRLRLSGAVDARAVLSSRLQCAPRGGATLSHHGGHLRHPARSVGHVRVRLRPVRGPARTHGGR